MTPTDRIRIHRLRVSTRIGVPESERAEAQEVELCLTMVPERGFADLDEEVANTVDYFTVTERLKTLAAEGERKLIETLAEDVAACVLAEFEVVEVAVEVRKFILPETEYVSVQIQRQRPC